MRDVTTLYVKTPRDVFHRTKTFPEHCLGIANKSEADAGAIRKICLRWAFTTHARPMHRKVTVIKYNVICEPLKRYGCGVLNKTRGYEQKFRESFYGIL
jgi:hypothetical protein